MKITLSTTTWLLLSFLLVSYSPATARTYLPISRTDEIFIFDQYGDIPFRDEQERLDNLAWFFSRARPDDVIFLVAYAGRRACVNEAQWRANRAKDYLMRRHQIPAEKIITIDGGFRETLQMELYVQPRSIEHVFEFGATVDPREAQVSGDCRAKYNRRRRGRP